MRENSFVAKLIKILSFTIIPLLSGIVLNFINKKVPFPYMDEHFHFKQTISFYQGNFKQWDSKLTTFPGVFLFNAAILKGLSFITFFRSFFPLAICRCINVITPVITNFILNKYIQSKNESNALENEFFKLIIIFLPISYFYNYLYYTDAFSTLSLILFFHITTNTKRFRFFSILLSGFISVLARQNNIIWLNLLPLSEVISVLVFLFKTLNIKDFVYKCLDIIKSYISILILDIMFVLFLIKNNFSVVLGDKSHHEMVINLAQINHFLFFVLFLFPRIHFYLLTIPKVLKDNQRLKKLITIFVILTAFLFVCNIHSHIHDFILSDNRHYTFYYFRKIYNVTPIKTVLTLYSSIIFSLVLEDNISLFFDSKYYAYGFCFILCLIPAKLVEVRYFTPCIIVLLLLLYKEGSNIKRLQQNLFNCLNILWHLVINCVVLYIFIYKPFKNEFFHNEMSRFMF